MNFTRGPWKAFESIEECPFPAGVPVAVGTEEGRGAKGSIVCSMYAQGSNGKYSSETTADNARLIAAAPDLYEVAKYALYEAYQSAHSSGDPNDESMMTGDAVLYRMAKAALAKAEGKTQ